MKINYFLLLWNQIQCYMERRPWAIFSLSDFQKEKLNHSLAGPNNFQRIINYFMPAIYHNFVSHRVNGLFSVFFSCWLRIVRLWSKGNHHWTLSKLNWRVAAWFSYGILIISWNIAPWFVRNEFSRPDGVISDVIDV